MATTVRPRAPYLRMRVADRSISSALIAQELFEGDVESELTQPFAISHNAYAPHPTSLDSVSFSATSTVDVLPTTTIDTDLSPLSPTDSPQTSAT